ncbi:MAG: hypothetical protein U1E83_09780 [Methylotetracoccus sp.]
MKKRIGICLALAAWIPASAWCFGIDDIAQDAAKRAATSAVKSTAKDIAHEAADAVTPDGGGAKKSLKKGKSTKSDGKKASKSKTPPDSGETIPTGE